MTSILRHIAETFSAARHVTILNSHRVIAIATNTNHRHCYQYLNRAQLRLSDLHDDEVFRTSEIHLIT